MRVARAAHAEVDLRQRAILEPHADARRVAAPDGHLHPRLLAALDLERDCDLVVALAQDEDLVAPGRERRRALEREAALQDVAPPAVLADAQARVLIEL